MQEAPSTNADYTVIAANPASTAIRTPNEIATTSRAKVGVTARGKTSRDPAYKDNGTSDGFIEDVSSLARSTNPLQSESDMLDNDTSQWNSLLQKRLLQKLSKPGRKARGASPSHSSTPAAAATAAAARERKLPSPGLTADEIVPATTSDAVVGEANEKVSSSNGNICFTSPAINIAASASAATADHTEEIHQRYSDICATEKAGKKKRKRRSETDTVSVQRKSPRNDVASSREDETALSRDSLRGSNTDPERTALERGKKHGDACSGSDGLSARENALMRDNTRRITPTLIKRPPGGPFGASKARAWHAQQVVQSAVTPMQVSEEAERYWNSFVYIF